MADRHVEIRGDKLVKQLLSEMKDRTQSVEEAWPSVGDTIAGHMEQQFESQGAHLGGVPWQPLQPDYLAWKIKKGFDPRILHKTGDMRASLTGRPMAVEEYRGNTAVFGTDDEKAAFHQSGAQNLPERAMIVLTEEFTDDVNQVLARYIFENRLS